MLADGQEPYGVIAAVSRAITVSGDTAVDSGAAAGRVSRSTAADPRSRWHPSVTGSTAQSTKITRRLRIYGA